ncbi:heme-dependent oxidative N-demethylase family protein [Arvimicrobium flavum]|uniref:heme-dependent oxidative N-demethylase family protein n=1 Tax=Arvimicrobium flavum TaxID=3393320 RepID=UPI00237B0B51|nr:DUF3445 domain-containing protein [Mesorhizobium shangrilense]
MTLPAHTPYDGSSKPFTIGLKPLDPATWIEIDGTFDVQMREKRRLLASIPEEVFVEEPDTRAAQREVLDMIRTHVAATFPDRYQPGCKGLAIAGHPALTTAQMETLPPLQAAAHLVQEDLILMRRGEDGWRLAAGVLCFPSSWSLREKFGKPLQQIHVPVPGFGPGTRIADLIHRMFDNLKVEQPVERMNWSLQAVPDLYYPLSNDQRDERATTRPAKFADLAAVARGFIRVERQTLRKLPASGDILFTIRIFLDPFEALRRHPDGAELSRAFASQLAAMDDKQLDYKGLTADRDRLIEALHGFAAEPLA